MSNAPEIRGQCLCGAHRFRLAGELTLMHHCHCGFCRKSHGTGFSTLIGVAKEDLHWEQQGKLISYRASEGYERRFCGECGSPLPAEGADMPIFVPTGLLEDSFDRQAEFHMFVASSPDWDVISDGTPAFDEYPPGIDIPVSPTRAPEASEKGVRGSCLCGNVRFVVEGEPIIARHCHCQRCRRARGAAHATNLVMRSDDFRFTHGGDRVAEFKLPGAKFFANAFCRDCGSAVPRVDLGRAISVVPFGALDDPAPVAPVEHIFVASKAAWVSIDDDLPQHAEYAPD